MVFYNLPKTCIKTDYLEKNLDEVISNLKLLNKPKRYEENDFVRYVFYQEVPEPVLLMITQQKNLIPHPTYSYNTILSITSYQGLMNHETINEFKKQTNLGFDFETPNELIPEQAACNSVFEEIQIGQKTLEKLY